MAEDIPKGTVCVSVVKSGVTGGPAYVIEGPQGTVNTWKYDVVLLDPENDPFKEERGL